MSPSIGDPIPLDGGPTAKRDPTLPGDNSPTPAWLVFWLLDHAVVVAAPDDDPGETTNESSLRDFPLGGRGKETAGDTPSLPGESGEAPGDSAVFGGSGRGPSAVSGEKGEVAPGGSAPPRGGSGGPAGLSSINALNGFQNPRTSEKSRKIHGYCS